MAEAGLRDESEPLAPLLELQRADCRAHHLGDAALHVQILPQYLGDHPQRKGRLRTLLLLLRHGHGASLDHDWML